MTDTETIYVDLSAYTNNVGAINWGQTVGNLIDVYYNNERKVIKIISYDYSRQVLHILYDGEYYEANADFLKNGRIKQILKKESVFIYNINDVLKDERRNLTIIDRFYYRTKLYKVKCNICGYEKVVSETELNSIKHTYSCACCNHKVVAQGTNDIPTTDPWMIPYFQGGYEEARLYTNGSSAKLLFKCPFCGKLSKTPRTITSLYHNKGITCECKDNISYPEKIMIYILNTLNVDYIYQVNKDILLWAEKYRYDFYLPELNMIIETHGEQHYTERNCFDNKRNQQEIDDIKRNLAKQNNIYNYIELNCSKSDINFIKDNILNSKLHNVLNLNETSINWIECDTYGRKNLIYEVCLYFNNNDSLTVDELSKHFKLERSTITKYLHTGTNLSWCNYNPKEKLKIGQKKTIDIMNQRRVEEHGFIYIYDKNKLVCKACNGHEAERLCNEKGYKICCATICRILKDPNKNTAKGLYIIYGK